MQALRDVSLYCARRAIWSRSWAHPAAARPRCSTASAASTRLTAAFVRVDGVDIKHPVRRRLAAATVPGTWCSLFQLYNLLPVLSAAENVELPLLLSRSPSDTHVGAALVALDLVKLAAG